MMGTTLRFHGGAPQQPLPAAEEGWSLSWQSLGGQDRAAGLRGLRWGLHSAGPATSATGSHGASRRLITLCLSCRRAGVLSDPWANSAIFELIEGVDLECSGF